MQNDLTPEHLAQEVTVKLPLSALLRLNDQPVPGVLLSARLDDLRTNRPHIGEKGLHGIYAGIARADEQGGDHILEALDAAPSKLTWQEAMDWAASIGGTLPTRKEQALLFANVQELFEAEWYWSCEQYAGGESCAWCQTFGGGSQGNISKSSKLRARAVRRVPIE